MRVYAQRRWTIYAHSLLSLQAHLRFSYTIVGTSRIWNQPGIQRCGRMAVIACVVTAHPLSRRFVAGCGSAMVQILQGSTRHGFVAIRNGNRYNRQRVTAPMQIGWTGGASRWITLPSRWLFA